MLLKRIIPSAWFRDEPVAHLVDIHSRGVDRDSLAKYASDEFVFNFDAKPEKDHSYIHLISLGAGERFGPNSNADFFNKCAGQHIAPSPQSPGLRVLNMSGGLDKYHDTFMKYGGVYREHNNSKKGGKRFGDVVAATVNPVMHRGELIIKVPNNLWADDLQKMASGGSIYFSMGSGVPFDHCSICHNKAKTRNDYCSHMRYQKLQLDKEGNQVFAINDEPHFHDISRVQTPADKIAFGLRKVASDGMLPDDAAYHYPDLAYIPTSLVDKLGSKREHSKAAALTKLSEMEKRILAEGMSSDEKTLCDSFNTEELPEDTIKKLASFPLADVLGFFKSASILLPPEAFVRVVLKKPSGPINGLDGLSSAVKTVYTDLAKEGKMNEVFEDSSYDPPTPRYWTELRSLTDKTASAFSLQSDIMQRRVLHSAVYRPNLSKSASASANGQRISAESRYLAAEYAKYQISFVAGADPIFATCVALQNQNCR